MPTTRKKRANSNKDKNVYEKVEDLPEGRKKIYESILEDFDKQGLFSKNSTFFQKAVSAAFLKHPAELTA
jgi:hypothetical protein